MEERVNELLPLAAKIAREFSNIPGLPHAEIELAAQEALAHAARLFDPAKGDFTAYAARAMRNALRDQAMHSIWLTPETMPGWLDTRNNLTGIHLRARFAVGNCRQDPMSCNLHLRFVKSLVFKRLEKIFVSTVGWRGAIAGIGWKIPHIHPTP